MDNGVSVDIEGISMSCCRGCCEQRETIPHNKRLYAYPLTNNIWQEFAIL